MYWSPITSLSARSVEVTSFLYREQSDETNTERTWPSTDVSRFDTYSKGSLAMQLISYINNHVATAFEVSQGSYVARSNELVKWQQAHVVIEIYY